MKNILVTGATGQIGSELTPALRRRYGGECVLAGVHTRRPDPELAESGPWCSLDVRDRTALHAAIVEHRIDTIVHLASLLSATAEEQPQLAWDVNVNGLINVLEAGREYGCAVFFPSSIAAFGPSTPAEHTPQDTIQRPNTMYGITKVTGELWCDYYHRRYGVDTRGLRYPGLVSSKTLPGGGTTDYAVHIFYAALKDRRYECFLKPDTRLDLMYMPDAVRAAMQLMEVDGTRLRHRNAYNVTAMSAAPQDLAAAIRRHIPDFSISYRIDPVRQAIADSWPRHMDDRAAREEWGWRPTFDLHAMAKDMLDRLSRHPRPA
ncbi:MAG: NAD-dependent epimerase/dehydratase family protein [Nitrospirota bacterium]